MRINRLLVAVAALLMLAAPARAQFSKSTMNAQTSQDFPDQNTGAITPAVTRGYLNNLIASYQQAPTVNPQVCGPYTVQLSDYGALLTFNCASPVAVTIPAATGSFATFSTFVKNNSTGVVTITPQSGTINGSASFGISQGAGTLVISDATNWQVWNGGAGAVGTGTVTNVATGTGLTGGPVTTTGTISIASIIAAAGPMGSGTVTPVVTFNAQGQLTAVTTATITPPFSAVTGQATLAQLPTIGANTVLGSIAGGTPAALSTTQITTLCNLFTASLSGCVPASGGGSSNFLRSDGSWTTPAGGGTVTSVGLVLPGIFTVTGSPVSTTGNLTGSLATEAANSFFAGPTSGGAVAPTFRALVLGDFPPIGNNSVLGNVSGISAAPSALSSAQLTALCNTFTSLLPGCVPASGGGASNFLRADGTWTTPAGGGTVTSVATGTDLTGGPITTTGTIGLSANVPRLNALNVYSVYQTLKAGPVIDANGYGCAFDGVTDDSSCWSSAIAALPASGGTIIMPPGKTSCVFTGITGTTDYVTMFLQGSLLSACGHDHYVVKWSGQRFDLIKAQVNGFNAASATQPAIWFSNCVACRTIEVDANFGFNALLVSGASTYRLFFSGFSSGYGTADMLVQGSSGGWCVSTAIDMNWPAGVPTLPATLHNWSAGATVATKDYYLLASGWMLQATVGGTTAGSTPVITTQTYTTNITDNTVTWRLLGKNNHDSTRYDAGTSQVFEWGCDHSGPYRAGIAILNTGGTDPSLINLTDTVMTGMVAGVYATAGTHLNMENNQVQNCQLTGCAGLLIDGFSGIGAVHGNDFQGNVIGIDVHTVTGNNVRMSFTGNVITGSPTTAISVDGASMAHYVIDSNICGGAAIVDSGTTPKIVQSTCP